jgi:putative membrane protein
MNDNSFSASSKAEGWALVALLSFTLVALSGYATFGLRPENLPAVPWATGFYSVSFPFFARAHILVTALVLGIALARCARARWIPAMLAIYAVSFLAEHAGTGFGIPFSGYSYTGLLGPKLAGRVPYLIPLSWFLMSVPAFVMARSTFPGPRRAFPRIALASVLLVVWDLALDPAMSFLTPYWLWEQAGPFYGMPWVNLLGWLLTGLVIMTVLEGMERVGDGWSGDLSPKWAAQYYGGVLLMPLGMVTLAGLWWSTAATVGALALLGAFHRYVVAGRVGLAADLPLGTPTSSGGRPLAGPRPS